MNTCNYETKILHIDFFVNSEVFLNLYNQVNIIFTLTLKVCIIFLLISIFELLNINSIATISCQSGYSGQLSPVQVSLYFIF